MNILGMRKESVNTTLWRGILSAMLSATTELAANAYIAVMLAQLGLSPSVHSSLQVLTTWQAIQQDLSHASGILQALESRLELYEKHLVECQQNLISDEGSLHGCPESILNVGSTCSPTFIAALQTFKAAAEQEKLRQRALRRKYAAQLRQLPIWSEWVKKATAFLQGAERMLKTEVVEWLGSAHEDMMDLISLLGSSLKENQRMQDAVVKGAKLTDDEAVLMTGGAKQCGPALEAFRQAKASLQ